MIRVTPDRAPVARVSRVPVTRLCAYRRWLPALAARCACWRCAERREALATENTRRAREGQEAA